METRVYAGRQSRKEEIFEVLKASPTPLTTYGVAKKINLRRSTHLQQILEEMTGVGAVVKSEKVHRTLKDGKVVKKYLFEVSQEYRQ